MKREENPAEAFRMLTCGHTIPHQLSRPRRRHGAGEHCRVDGTVRLPSSMLRRCWFLAGPTAVGKTELSLRLAEQLNAEILSMDSMAIFREMDIGTAKPDAAARSRVPHHLIDLADPSEEFSTAEYLKAAYVAVEEIRDRDKIPLFVGGTGLYLRSLLRGVFEGPAADWQFRKHLMDEAQREGATWLHARLAAVDPFSANRLHPNDERRIVRALEIYQLTGEPASAQQQQGPLPPEERPECVVWLHPRRDWLNERIHQRVDQMFEAGLVDETQRLLSRERSPGRTARQALGYREVIDWLEGRLESEDAARELICTRTRQFAKRQHTWFRNLAECHELPIQGTETADELCERVVSLSRNGVAGD